MDILYVLVPIVVIGFFLFFVLLPKYGPRYTSRLICPHCQKAFYFHWILGATLTSLRYGNRRRLKCPYCGQVNTFNIASTRISQPKTKWKV